MEEKAPLIAPEEVNLREAADALGAACENTDPATHPTTTETDSGSAYAPVCSLFEHSAAVGRLSACCHGGAKMAVLAYSLGKREINQYFSIKNAKLLSCTAVLLLIAFHSASRYYGGKCDAQIHAIRPARQLLSLHSATAS